MKRKIAVLFLILCLCLTACRGEVEIWGQDSQQQSQAQTESTISPLLYRVTDQKGNVLWLFGSIHVGIESYYPLPDYVLQAYESSDALAVEVDIIAMEWNVFQQMQLLQQLMYTDGSTIGSHIPAETYHRAVEILQENNIYSEQLESYMPAFWWSAIESLAYEKMGAQSQLGIDRYFIKQAMMEDKEIREVESAEFQYALMANFSPQLQQLLLESAIDTYDNMETAAADVDEMMRLWAAGDEAAFGAYLTEEVEITDPEEAALYQEYNTQLITLRNQSMTQYAIEALASGEEIFLCVGAAHIVGEGAIAENLRQLGYQVEAISQ